MTNDHEQLRPTFRSHPLTDSELHVWCAALNASPNDLAYYSSILSSDEKARAERFYFEIDRHHYIAGRGILRSLVGGYLDIKPAQIEFVYGQYGKPALRDQTLEFNLSHSMDMALYIFSLGHKVGIDIEFTHPMPEMDKFAAEHFTPGENKLIHSLPEAQKLDTFFKIWTCKEAFLKANGFGLTIPINQVEISLDVENSAILNVGAQNKEQTQDWRLELLTPVDGYRAALAVKGFKGQVVFRELSDQFR